MPNGNITPPPAPGSIEALLNEAMITLDDVVNKGSVEINGLHTQLDQLKASMLADLERGRTVIRQVLEHAFQAREAARVIGEKIEEKRKQNLAKIAGAIETDGAITTNNTRES